MGECFCVLIGNLVRLQMYDCGAYNGPFRTHYFNHSEESLMMAPMEYRNMLKKVSCICCAYIPLHVRLVLWINF